MAKTRDQSAILPANVAVCFASTWNDDGPSDPAMPNPYIITVAIATVIGTASTGTGAPANLTGMSAATKIFHTSCQALFTTAGGTTTPTNNTNLTTLANRIAQDYYAWRLIAYDRVISGIVAHQQDGYADAVEWSYLPPELGGARTRAYARPGNDEPEELIQSDAPPWIPTKHFYYIKSGGSGIAAATSATAWKSATVTIQKESYTGAVTAASGPLTWPCWNADSSAAIPANRYGGMTRTESGKYLWTYLACGT